MHMQHDLGRLFPVLAEEALEHMDDEFHGRVIVVQHQHLVQRRLLRLRPRLNDGADAIIAADAILVAHRSSAESFRSGGDSLNDMGSDAASQRPLLHHASANIWSTCQ
jgi:hypothetical protein